VPTQRYGFKQLFLITYAPLSGWPPSGSLPFGRPRTLFLVPFGRPRTLFLVPFGRPRTPFGRPRTEMAS